ncbi:MAG: EamA family transporter [Kiloniellaceae bacterium]
MALDVGVLLLVLLAAALHASWNALVKAGEDRLVMTTLVVFVPGLPCLAAVSVLPALETAAWPYLIASVVVHFAYFAVLLGAYRHGDLSQVYPIARGAAPALVALEAWAFAGEALRAAEVAGVLIVSGGIMSLAWRGQGTAGGGEIKAIAFALLTALSIAVYLLADGMGVRRSGFALTYICWLFALTGVPLFGFTVWRRRGRIAASFGANLKLGFAGGLIAGISYGIAIWAMGVGPMAHVVAVRETSVLIGAAIGTFVLKEPFGRHRIVAAAAVATGAVLLNLGR